MKTNQSVTNLIAMERRILCDSIRKYALNFNFSEEKKNREKIGQSVLFRYCLCVIESLASLAHATLKILPKGG